MPLALCSIGQATPELIRTSTATDCSHHTVAALDRFKFRVVIELSRPITCAEHARLLAYVTSLLPIAPDPSCKDPTRLFGLPMMYHPCDFVNVSQGEPLDVDAMLELAPATPAPAQTTAQPLLEATLSRAEVSKLANKWARSDVADVATRGRLVKQLLQGDAFATAETERHGTMLQLTAALEREFQNATPVAIAELFRPSICTMSAADPSFDIETRMSDTVRAIEGIREKRKESEAEARALKRSPSSKAAPWLSLSTVGSLSSAHPSTFSPSMATAAPSVRRAFLPQSAITLRRPTCLTNG
jgi:hypothetical protein